MKHPHYFFALSLPEIVKQSLSEEFQQRNLPFAQSVHEQDLHLTLAFLGAASMEQIELTVSHVSKAIEGMQAFALTIESFGFFGSSNAPRIFWAGVKDEVKLSFLQQAVYKACLDTGFKLEDRPFRPHITLARKWQSEHSYQPPESPSVMKFIANQVVLYQTHLDRVPKYETKHMIMLTE